MRSAIPVGSAGNIYVADTRNGRIQVFDSSGNFLRQFGGFGSGDGQFLDPEGVAVDASTVDASGRIIVADQNNYRILVFDSSGNFLLQFGVFGSGDGQFNRPFGVAVDASSNIYVADTDNNRIQVFVPCPVSGCTIVGLSPF